MDRIKEIRVRARLTFLGLQYVLVALVQASRLVLPDMNDREIQNLAPRDKKPLATCEISAPLSSAAKVAQLEVSIKSCTPGDGPNHDSQRSPEEAGTQGRLGSRYVNGRLRSGSHLGGPDVATGWLPQANLAGTFSSTKGDDAIRAADIPPTRPALDRRRERLLAAALADAEPPRLPMTRAGTGSPSGSLKPPTTTA